MALREGGSIVLVAVAQFGFVAAIPLLGPMRPYMVTCKYAASFS